MSPEVEKLGTEAREAAARAGVGEGEAELGPSRLGDRAGSAGFIPSTVESNHEGFVRGANRRDTVLFREGVGSDVWSCHSPGVTVYQPQWDTF